MDAVLDERKDTNGEVLTKLELYIPKWVETLSYDHPVKEGLLQAVASILKTDMTKSALSDLELKKIRSLAFVSKAVMEETEKGAEEGTAKIRVEIDDVWYYKMLSSLTGVEIDGEYQLISMIRNLSGQKNEYKKAEEALLSVRRAGYGVITPEQSEIHLEEPVMIHQGNKFGVKIKATCPSIHLIRADIETEISPIVGNEQQAQDLIAYIKDSSGSGEGIWETNIFGKSIEQLTEDGIRAKLSQIGEESQQKLQNVMQRIVNESTGGFICIIL